MKKEEPEDISMREAEERAALIDSDPNVVALRAAARLAANIARK